MRLGTSDAGSSWLECWRGPGPSSRPHGASRRSSRWRTKTCCASKLRCRKRDAAPLRASEMKMRPLCELHPDGKDCVYFAYMCHNRRAKRTTWQRLVKETKMRPRSRLHAACCTPTPEGLCARPADHEGDCDSRVAHEDG